MLHAPADWIRQLRALVAQRGLDPKAPLGLDDLDGPFRAAVGADLVARGPLRSPEAKLWRARCDPAIDITALIDFSAEGPLLPQSAFLAIEVWTDAELSALHALSWLALAPEDGSAQVASAQAASAQQAVSAQTASAQTASAQAARLDRARLWHLEHTQPDNATNRPWAIHVFVRPEDAESMHYAQTLLHNAIAQDGIPTTLGAWILEDCARWMERAARVTDFSDQPRAAHHRRDEPVS